MDKIREKQELQEWEDIYLRLKRLVAKKWLETKDEKWAEEGKKLNESWERIKQFFA